MFDKKLELLKELMGEAGGAMAHELRGRYKTDGVTTDKSAASAGGPTEPEAAPDLLLKDLQDPAIQKLLGGLLAEQGDNNSDKDGAMSVTKETVAVSPAPEMPEPAEEPAEIEVEMKKSPSDEEEDENAEVSKESLDRASKQRKRSIWSE